MRAVSSRFAETILRSHQIATLVEVISNGVVLQEITDAISGGVTLDVSAAIRGSLDLQFVDDGSLGLVPTDASSLIAPYGNEIKVGRGVTYPDGSTEICGLGVYRINDVDVDDTPDGGMQVRVTGQDRSARVSDAKFEAPYQIAAGTNFATAILNVLQLAYPDIRYRFAVTDRTTPLLNAAEGDDPWVLAMQMAASIGMQIYFDGDGICILDLVAQIGSTPDVELVEGEDGVLLTASRAWSRTNVRNRVIVTGENTGEAAPARGVATDDNPNSPTYYFGSFGRVPMFAPSSFVTTDDQAVDAAQALLVAQLGTTQNVSFGTLVNPALEPGDIARITRLRAGIDENNIIDQLTIPLGSEGTITGRTRALQVT